MPPQGLLNSRILNTKRLELFPPARSILTHTLGPRLRHTLHDNPPGQPMNVHIHKYNITRRLSSKCCAFPCCRAIFVRDGRGDGRPTCLDESH